MPVCHECVVCGFKLPGCKRRDCRYCGSKCRVRALRARRRGHSLAGRWKQHAGRLPDPAPDSPLTRARTRIAIERALRGERARRENIEACLARTEKEAAEQRRALTAEKDALHTALSNEQKDGAETARQLDAAQAQVKALNDELASVRRELMGSKAEGAKVTASLKESREFAATLRQNFDSTIDRLLDQKNSVSRELAQEREARATAHQKAEAEAYQQMLKIDDLYKKLIAAKSANLQLAPPSIARRGSQDDAEEHKSKKKLKRELAEAQAQLAEKQLEVQSVMKDRSQAVTTQAS